MRLIDADPLYEKACNLEARALDYVGKLNERDGDEPSDEWKVWNVILIERTAFKHDVFDAPTAQPEIIRCKDCAKRECCRTSTVWAVAPADDWYCADAERRTDG